MTDAAPSVIAFDTTYAIAEAMGDNILNDPRPEIHNAEKIISVVVRMELQAKLDLPPEEIAKRKIFLDRVAVVPLDDTVEEEAIKLRQYTNLKLPDAIIAATAVRMGAVLLSYDEHFDNLDWLGLIVKKYL